MAAFQNEMVVFELALQQMGSRSPLDSAGHLKTPTLEDGAARLAELDCVQQLLH